MNHGDGQERIAAERSERVERCPGLSRRDLFRNTAGALLAAAGAAVAGARAAAQVTGTTPEGGSVPLRLPMCTLDYLDRKQYVHNMEIHAHLPLGGLYQGDRVTAPLWVKGTQRLLLSGGGRFVDITDPRKPAVFSKVEGNGQIAYATHLKKWIMLNSAGQPISAPNPKYPRGQYDKEYAARSMNFTGLRGIRTFDVTDPSKSVLLQEFSTGKTGGGTHANFYDGGKYAYLECGWDDQLRMESTERPVSNGLMIVDVSDPAHIKEVSRWWVPGQRKGEEEQYKKWPFAGDQAAWTSNHGAATVPKRVEDGGNVGYAGFGSFGMYVLDLTDITKPKVFGRAAHPLEGMGGIPYHGIYPLVADASHPRLQNLVVAVFEGLEADCREPFHTSYVINVKDPRNPKIIGLFPRPIPPKDAPYLDFCCARGRFSSHNAQPWAAPGVMKPNFVALTYFNAGIRIYDISDPTDPKEVAYFVPPRDGEINDFESWRRGTTEGVLVEWDRNLIWMTTHEGLYCMSTPSLGKPVLEPRRVTRWTVPHFNAGWDDQTAKTVYLGSSLKAVQHA
jgi:hypothetical protein